VGLHKAIFNQDAIDLKGLIEPACKYCYIIFGISVHAGFMTQQGQAILVHNEALL
jgi:hypothetical protein